MKNGISLIQGQIYGKVDWVSSDRREAGLYIRTNDSKTTRCVLVGPLVQDMLATHGVLEPGLMVTVIGLLSSRCANPKAAPSEALRAEMVCVAEKVTAERSFPVRVRGSIHVLMKGVIMHWEPNVCGVKTFLNTENDVYLPKKLVISIALRTWVAGLQNTDRFMKAMRSGREYTLAGLADASVYRASDGCIVPIVQVLPVDFKLQV